MKLHLILEDDDGQKVERIINKDPKIEEIADIIYSMAESLRESKKPL